ncbi:hypothetical protein R3P38DRAFT_3190290 [Favolaschia claudopus]|uniref:Uncharacterized protein n=1 Tax=Favolaschia claudopus TaxID=2862362 RepID=A0AAW0BRC0_9AGAR
MATSTPTTKIFTAEEDKYAVNALPQSSSIQLLDAESGSDIDSFPVTVPDLFGEGQWVTTAYTADLRMPEGSAVAAPKPVVLSGVPCVIM